VFKWLQPDPNRPHWSQLVGFNFRRLIFWLLLFSLIGLAGWLAYPRIIYRIEAKAFARAAAFLHSGDSRSAVLTLTQILERDPSHLEAARLMAEIAEKAGSPAALQWRRHVAGLEPNDRNVLAWANQAIRFGDLEDANRALAKVSVVGHELREFHQAAAAVALMERDSVRAAVYLAEVSKLEPTNNQSRLNLALSQLATGDPGLRNEAVKSLEGLRSNPATRLSALRGLLGDSERRNDTNQMLRLASEVIQQTNATAADKIQHLNAVFVSRSPGYAKELAALQRELVLPPDIYLLSSWLTARGMAREAEAWLKTLPPTLAVQNFVALALAECLLAQKRWADLRMAARGTWWRLEHRRLALAARAARESGEGISAQRQWNLAVAETANDDQRLAELARLALAWRWEVEAETLLWRLSQGGRFRTWALQSLYSYYSSQKDTRRLLRVCRAALQASPTDPVAKNNFASLSLLLNESVADARKFAAEVYELQPENPGFASTHAFSLLGQSKAAEARAVMGRVPEKWLAAPSMAACYGLVLAAAGENELAFSHLDRAKKSGRLLREEEVLVNAALAKLKER
jgi:hypothetical protein